MSTDLIHETEYNRISLLSKIKTFTSLYLLLPVASEHTALIIYKVFIMQACL